MSDKYTFRREFTDMYGATKVVEHTVDAETLSDILEDFLYFINGCSFSYVRDLIYVKEDGQEVQILGYEVNEPETVEDLDQLTLDLQEAVLRSH